MSCSDRCKNAKKDSKCVCSCHGQNHARYNDNKSPLRKLMTTEMGGEVEKFIHKWKGIVIKCYGKCRKTSSMMEFFGYPHEAGLADKDGNTWWVYFECPECEYGHSFSKMDFFLRHTKIEINEKKEAEKNGRL